jgi:hypothetical protein
MEQYDEDVSAQRKTHVRNDGRSITFPLCEYNIKISNLKDDIFVRTSNENKVAPSVEDKQFLSLMKSDFQQDDTGHWSAPLPFKQPKPHMPNNLDSSLRKNQNKFDHFITFMDKVLKSGVRSGPDIKRLFKETPSKIADESKTPLI